MAASRWRRAERTCATEWCDDRNRRVAIARGQRGGGRAEAVAKDLGVTDPPELPAEPAEVVAERVGPRLVEQRPEGAQIAAQAAGGDSRLVDVLGIDAQPDAWVVAEEADHRQCSAPGGQRRRRWPRRPA